MKKRVRSFLLILFAVVMLCCAPVMLDAKAETPDGLDLSNMQIVVPAQSTAVERSAAGELQHYIGEITGKNLSIVKEGENSGAGIYVGATAYATANFVSYPTEGDSNGEAWSIQVVEDNVVLCGAPERGVLYAAYHLLEDVLGVRWWNLWEEYVPQGDAIVPYNYADSGVPAMEYRETYVGKETTTDYLFYVRNRINGNTTHIPETYGGSEVYGKPAHVHTFARYFSSADFAAHPEWFSMDEKGNRVSDRQLCLSNTELEKEFAKRLIANVAGDPDAIYAVCPNDNKYLCACPDCKQDIQTYGSAGYVLNFVNKMAKAVSDAGYPDTSIEMLVYWMYLDFPKGDVKLEPNVTIRYADNYTDLLHGVNHVNNTKSLNTLKKWLEISDNDFYYWQYVVNYRNNGIFPSMFHYGDDVTTLYELGVNGWFGEQEQCINVDFWDMKLWLLAKLMEEPVTGEEYAALMDEFIYGYYGEEAGQYIRDYLYYMNEKAEASYVNQNFGTYIIDAEWLDVRDILAGNEYFNKAFAAAGDDAVLLRRLRAARCGFDRVCYENFGRWEDQADAFGLKWPFTKRELGERIYEAMHEQIAMRGSYDIDYMMFFSLYDQYTDDLPALPEELSDVAREHVLEYTADDFRLTPNYTVVADTDSLLGNAVCGNGVIRQDRDKALIMGEGYMSLDFALYNPNGEGDEIVILDQLTAAEIIADGEYHLYQYHFTVPYIGRGSYVYLFRDWGMQLELMAEQLREMEGQEVEIYLSMKVEGVVDGSDPNNYPIYYVDRVLVVPAGEQKSHNYVNDHETGRSVCQICGDVILFDVENASEVDPEQYSKMVLWLAAGGVADLVGFGFLLYMMNRKRKRK